MINNIRGTIIAVKGAALTVDIGFLSLEINIAQPTLYMKDQPIALHTYFHWHQEQGPTLFGFSSMLERQLFITLIDCQGLGPKMALSILSQISASECIAAISLGNTKTLGSLKGIGPKKAETIVLQLQDKIKKLLDQVEPGSDSGNTARAMHLKSISDVLESLHYSRPEIAQALDHVKNNSTLTSSFDEGMRKALSYLAKSQ